MTTIVEIGTAAAALRQALAQARTTIAHMRDPAREAALVRALYDQLGRAAIQPAVRLVDYLSTDPVRVTEALAEEGYPGIDLPTTLGAVQMAFAGWRAVVDPAATEDTLAEESYDVTSGAVTVTAHRLVRTSRTMADIPEAVGPELDALEAAIPAPQEA